MVQILGLLGMYFDAVVVPTPHLALAILCIGPFGLPRTDMYKQYGNLMDTHLPIL